MALRITDELRDAKSIRNDTGDTFIITLGENLALNAELLSQALFATVQVVNGAATLSGPADVVLTPRFVSSVQVMSSFPVEFEYKIAAVLEWNVTDVNGNVVWLDTITGTGRLTDYPATTERLLEALFSDLFHKSYYAFSSAPEIRKFAERKSASVRENTGYNRVTNITSP